MIDKQELVEAIYTYLSMDQKADDRWHSPGPDNTDYWRKVKIDSEKLADIAIEILEKRLK